MPSKAYEKLQENRKDLDILWSFHEEKSGDAPGRKFGVEPLNKAVVVFVCALWGAYCEDVVAEAIDLLAADCNDPNLLPKELRKHIAAQIKGDKNDLAVWQLAEAGWKLVLKNNATKFTKDLTGRWNTPKSLPVQELFLKALGIKDITANWSWRNSDSYSTRRRLDEFVGLRGGIAHRLVGEESVHKAHGTDFFTHIERIATIVDASVRDLHFSATNKHYW